MSNPSPKDVQHALNAAGASPPLTEDGAFGPLSQAALRTFQASRGLVVDGIAGPLTLSALGFESATAIAPSNVTPLASSAAPATGRTVLPDRSTPLTAADAAKAFNAAYQKVTGKVPTPAVLSLLLAQSAFETGNWGAGVHNFNFGNAKASASDACVQYFRCTEVINGETVAFDPPSPTCCFAAFKNATDGAIAYIKLLQGRAHWWAGLQSGTVPGFVAGLTASPAYFTADPNTYAAGLTRYVNQYVAMAQKYAAPVVSLMALVWAAGAIGALGWLFFSKPAQK